MVVQESRLPADPALVSVAKRLTKALLLYYKKQPVKVGEVSWSQFFSDVMQDSPNGMTFQELEIAVREKLKAKVSRYELRCFWRRVDSNEGGMVTIGEWTQLMYAIELSTWPDLTKEELDAAVRVLNAAAEKWHHAGGNWFKIFSAIDTDGSGSLSFSELQTCVRASFPGLRLKESELSERNVHGLWKLLDSEGEIEVPVAKFMAFMRKHGAAHSMHRVTTYSLKKRGTFQVKETLPEAPERTNDELRAIIANLENAMNHFFLSLGFHSHGSSEGNWTRFFRDADTSGSGRLTYKDFCAAAWHKLGKWLTVSQDDIRALWGLLDLDNSMEVSIKEVLIAIYRLNLETWPDVGDEEIMNAITCLNGALKKRFNAKGNWYKAFNIVDADGSGRLRFSDFRDLVRDSFHGLSLPKSKLSDAIVKGFWKRLDTNLTGDATVAEFMNFMRKHAGQKNSMHRLTEFSKKQRGLVQQRRESFSKEIAGAAQFDPITMAEVASRLTLAIHDWLLSRNIRVDARKPQLWPRLIELVPTEKPGRFTFADLLHTARTVLHIVPEEGFEDPSLVEALGTGGRGPIAKAHLLAFWREVDQAGKGEAKPMEFDRAVYSLQMETWPLLEDYDLRRIVSVMSQAADKWHRAFGNWYKVFKACDCDGSGNLSLDELFGVSRDTFPGLSISAKVVTDSDLKGLWRAVDSDRSGLLDVKEFMVFMRTYGVSMHRPTAYSKKLRGLSKEAVEVVPEPSPLSGDELRAVSRQLSDALLNFWRRKGVSISHTELWDRFFKEGDTKKIGRLSYLELDQHLRSSLQRTRGPSSPRGPASPKRPGSPSGRGPSQAALNYSLNYSSTIEEPEVELTAQQQAEQVITPGVRRGDLRALWLAVLAEMEVPATMMELDSLTWRVGIYRLELQSWPEPTDATIASVVQKISAQANKWYRAGGNWFKIFKIVQAGNNSDSIDFHEFVDILKRPLPALAMTEKQLPMVELKSFWKAMDADRSGAVDLPEFMCFMRRWEIRGGGSHAPKAAAGSIVDRFRRTNAMLNDKPVLSPEESLLMRSRMGLLNEDDLRRAYEHWGIHWDGMVSEWDFVRVIREVAGLSEAELSDDAVHAAWCALEGSSDGKVSVWTVLVNSSG